jgi:hypothetical protein
MSALPKAPTPANPCPFCGVVAGVPHETQEGCIAALNTEIAQMRGLLANLKPAGAAVAVDEQDETEPAVIRLALD